MIPLSLLKASSPLTHHAELGGFSIGGSEIRRGGRADGVRHVVRVHDEADLTDARPCFLQQFEPLPDQRFVAFAPNSNH